MASSLSQASVYTQIAGSVVSIQNFRYSGAGRPMRKTANFSASVLILAIGQGVNGQGVAGSKLWRSAGEGVRGRRRNSC